MLACLARRQNSMNGELSILLLLATRSAKQSFLGGRGGDILTAGCISISGMVDPEDNMQQVVITFFGSPATSRNRFVTFLSSYVFFHNPPS